MAVVSDFFEDVRRDAEAALARLGVALPAGADAHRTVVELFHLERRLIAVKPREVRWSSELRARMLTSAEGAAVDAIAKELEQGIDVAPRMTTAIRKAGYNDGLLTDWGIHHLHIGTAMRRDGFVERDGPLLFVFVTGEIAHLLELLDHDSFEDDDLIEIVHGNWPEVIAAHRPPGVVPGSLTPLASPEQRKKLRRKFVSGTQMKDGTIYLPPGGGVMLSGHSMEAVQRANALLNLVHPAEVWARENAEWIATRLEALTGTRPSELTLRFHSPMTVQLGEAVLLETGTGALVRPPNGALGASVAVIR